MARKQKGCVNGAPSTPQLTEASILRADIRRLQRDLKHGEAAFRAQEAKCNTLEQLLSTLLHAHHPEGVTITDDHRTACDRECMFQVGMKFEDDGSAFLAAVPLTEEQITELKKKKGDGPDLILPPSAQ